VGARLEGPALPRRAADRGLPEPVLPGAIQVTTDGGLVVLGPDCPTTGGYPVIGLLPAEDRALFFRLRPGHPVRFLLR
jgi:allophanate hydrolase subunit 2